MGTLAENVRAVDSFLDSCRIKRLDRPGVAADAAPVKAPAPVAAAPVAAAPTDPDKQLAADIASRDRSVGGREGEGRETRGRGSARRFHAGNVNPARRG